MSNIRIYSKKAFAFGQGASHDGKEFDLFVTVPRAFQEMPEKYMTDPTFKLACRCGDVIVYNDAPVVAVPAADSATDNDAGNAADNSADNTVDNAVEDGEKSKEELISEFKEQLKLANVEKVEELAGEYGAEFVKTDNLKTNKKRVLEAYKLSLAD